MEFGTVDFSSVRYGEGQYALWSHMGCFQGTRYVVLVQVRVDPTKCKIAKPAGEGPLKDSEYWTVPDSDAIRAYAICLYAV